MIFCERLIIKKVRLIGILFLILVSSSFTIAQPFVDLIQLKYQRFPSVKYVGNESNTMGINQLSCNLNVPVELKNKNFLLLSGTYDQQNFLSSDSLNASKRLYSISLQVGYLKTWKGGRWKTLLLAIPKINTDYISNMSHSYQQGGILLFTYVKRENLKYKFGLYYNREFFGNFFMPLLGIEWKPNPRLNVFGVLPGSMNFEYRMTKRCYAGFSYQSITASYRFHDSNEKVFIRNGARGIGHNQYRLFFNYYATKSLVLFTEAGYTFGRKFEAYQDRITKIEQPVFHQTKDGFLINMGMAFRIRL